MKTLFLLLMSLILVLPTSAQLASESEISLSYQNISLSYDASPGTSIQLETIPAVDTSQDLPWWGLLPQHQQITLQDYAQNREFMPGRIMLFPFDAYQLHDSTQSF